MKIIIGVVFHSYADYKMSISVHAIKRKKILRFFTILEASLRRYVHTATQLGYSVIRDKEGLPGANR
ncbi:hypothetical protein S2091_0165 [Solimicrobium silvestre]|uniref:Uncharacterized protein n=1 Tax=Solimicrobium silvestre TaxID=2099400 RepID=A0A2S9H4Q7_9BURK|nr:hypothetical protein S2091_0165 [Solimicrobium silvestre]